MAGHKGYSGATPREALYQEHLPLRGVRVHNVAVVVLRVLARACRLRPLGKFVVVHASGGHVDDPRLAAVRLGRPLQRGHEQLRHLIGTAD